MDQHSAKYPLAIFTVFGVEECVFLLISIEGSWELSMKLKLTFSERKNFNMLSYFYVFLYNMIHKREKMYYVYR